VSIHYSQKRNTIAVQFSWIIYNFRWNSLESDIFWMLKLFMTIKISSLLPKHEIPCFLWKPKVPYLVHEDPLWPNVRFCPRICQ
jgi:hypothetical protein